MPQTNSYVVFGINKHWNVNFSLTPYVALIIYKFVKLRTFVGLGRRFGKVVLVTLGVLTVKKWEEKSVFR